MKRYFAISVGLCVAALATGNLVKRSAEAPRFEHRSLQQWARLLTTEPVSYRRFLHLIGPELIPHLLAEIECCESDGVFYRLYLGTYIRLPIALQQCLTRPTPLEERRLNAIGLLGDFGRQAKPAVPTLIRLLRFESLVGSVLTTLQRIGPAAEAATPGLVELLEREEPQPFVASTLVKIQANPKLALPALRRAGTNGPVWFRLEVARALHQMALEADPAFFLGESQSVAAAPQRRAPAFGAE
jgi:hypothetical protein